jgi:glycerate dehydrogenase
MNIVILDGYTANPGDLSWDEFHQLGDCTVYDRTPEPQVAERACDAEVVLTNKSILSRAAIAALPRLRYIGVLATGYNVVDTAAAREAGIPVCNVPEYSTPNVAQAVFALLLELTNHTGHHAQAVRDGRWTTSKDFCFWDFPLVELRGLTLGIIGYGRIGQAVGEIGRAFGMRILAVRRGETPRPTTDLAGRAVSSPPPVDFVSLDQLLPVSDVVTLHCPLTPETKQFINAGRLA